MKVVFPLLVLIISLLETTIAHSAQIKEKGNLASHKCIHDELQSKYPIKFIDTAPKSQKTQKSRVLQNEQFMPIRIHLDFSKATVFVTNNPQYLKLFEMSKRLLTKVVAYFEDTLKVRRQDVYSLPSFPCGEDFMTTEQQNAPFDLFISIKAEDNKHATYFAAAQVCAVSTGDKRPVSGLYYLNFASMLDNSLNEFFYYSVFAHEFTHILGFSFHTLQLFPMDIEKIVGGIFYFLIFLDIIYKGQSFKSIILPSIVHYAREYFQCDKIQGLPLENGGGAGSENSHWDKLFLPTEYMNPTIENPGYISRFSLILLRESGWYNVKLKNAQFYDWGMKDGCAHFFEGQCPQGKEYCPSSQLGHLECTPDFSGFAICSGSQAFLGGQCSYLRSSGQAHCTVGNLKGAKPFETYGIHSRCFISHIDNLITPICATAAVKQ